MMLKTDIILVSYNGSDDTIMCIESLWQMPSQGFRIIVVENCSTDDSPKKLQKFVEGKRGIVCPVSTGTMERTEHRLCLLLSDSNKGFAAGNNIGIRFSTQTADATFIWLLNNDTTVDSNALNALIAGHEKRKEKRNTNPGIL